MNDRHGCREVDHPENDNYDSSEEERIADIIVLLCDLGRTCDRMDGSLEDILEMLAERNLVRRLLGLSLRSRLCLRLRLCYRCRLSYCSGLSYRLCVRLCYRLSNGLCVRLSCRCGLSCCYRSCCNGSCCNGLSYRLCDRLCCRCGLSCRAERHSATAAKSYTIRVFFSAIRTKHSGTLSSGMKTR